MKKCLATFIFLLLSAPALHAQSTHPPLQFELLWKDNSSNEDGFRIEQCVGVGCTAFKAIGQPTPANATSYVDTIIGDPGNRTICYRVKAFNAGGETSPSNVACMITPMLPPDAAPTELKATQISRTSIHLGWTDDQPVSAYEVARNNAVIGETMAGVKEYADSDLRRNTWYTYKVRRGPNASHYSPWSEAIKAKTRR